MYIRTDDDHNILEVIVVGMKPETNGYEVDTIDEEILSDVLSYKYIDGNFVKKETDMRLEKIDDIKQIKISMMSSICQNVIEGGFDLNDEHYSLSAYDQINIMKLESQARLNPDQPLPYHADGELCKLYTAEDIITLAEYATGWKLYWSTYFNHLKNEILNMTDVDQIISVKFGQTLSDDSNTSISQILGDTVFTITPIVDDFDYDSLFVKVNASDLLSTDQRLKEVAALAEQQALEEAERLAREQAELEQTQAAVTTSDDNTSSTDEDDTSADVEEVVANDEESAELSD